MRSRQTKYRDIYRDSNNKIFYCTYLGRNAETGKRIYKKSRKSLSGEPFRTEHQAYKTMIRVKDHYLERDGRANYRIHFNNFMKDHYIPAYKSNVERSTYRSHFRIFQIMIHRFGRKLLNKINARNCEDFRIWLLNKSGYSKSYCSLIYIAFRQSLDYAVRFGFLDNNPAKKTKSISKGKSLVPFWTKQDFEKVLSSIGIETYYGFMCFIIIWLYYMTGMRVSEGLALRWEDVDLKDHKLRIFHTLDMINKHHYRIKNYTKTFAGKRTISLDNDTVRFLKKWRRIQLKHHTKDLVMSYDDVPLSRSTIDRIVHRYAKKAHVQQIQPKGLRHSSASYLINELGANVLIVSKRLGHSSPAVTLRYYAHLWDHSDDDLVKKMAGDIHFKPNNHNDSSFSGNQNVRSKFV